METKEDYRKGVEKRLERWNAKIDELQIEAKQAEAEAEVEYDRQLKILREKKEEVQKKLDELKTSDDKSWKKIRKDLERASWELEEAVDIAIATFE